MTNGRAPMTSETIREFWNEQVEVAIDAGHANPFDYADERIAPLVAELHEDMNAGHSGTRFRMSYAEMADALAERAGTGEGMSYADASAFLNTLTTNPLHAAHAMRYGINKSRVLTMLPDNRIRARVVNV